MSDVLFVGLTLLFSLLSFGLIAFCQRIAGGSR
jgi:hypothetical protein